MNSRNYRCRYGFLDAHVAVVWKEGGIATSGPGGDTLERRVLADLGGSLFSVHRLDRETCGWVLFARTQRAAARCSSAFESGNVRKVYAMLAHGEIGGLAELSSDVNGKHSHTICEVQAAGKLPGGGPAAAVLACPITGRTHQLRIHFCSAGHGLVGDARYPDPGGSPWYRGHGLFLSAVGLRIPHPEGGADILCISPLPKKFRKMRWVPVRFMEARILHLLTYPPT